jgi:hypothetical protein
MFLKIEETPFYHETKWEALIWIIKAKRNAENIAYQNRGICKALECILFTFIYLLLCEHMKWGSQVAKNQLLLKVRFSFLSCALP